MSVHAVAFLRRRHGPSGPLPPPRAKMCHSLDPTAPEYPPFTIPISCCREAQAVMGSANQGCPRHSCHLSPGRLKEPTEYVEICAQPTLCRPQLQCQYCKLSVLQGFSNQISVHAALGKFIYQEIKPGRILPDYLTVCMEPVCNLKSLPSKETRCQSYVPEPRTKPRTRVSVP